MSLPTTADRPLVLTEILNSEGQTMAQAGRRFSSHKGDGDGKVHPSTIFRWITKGVKLPNGEVLRLEGVRVGARWMTSIPALTRFIERQTAVYSDPNTPLPLTPRGKQLAEARAARAAERAGQMLEALGI